MYVVIAAIVGAAIGYAFRGYISKEKTAAGNALKASAEKAIAEAKAKL